MRREREARAADVIKRLFCAVIMCVFLFLSVEASAVTVIITNTADAVVDTEYDSDLCSVEVNERNSNDEGIRKFLITVNINENHHKHGFTLSTTSGTVEKIGEKEYLLTVRGGEQPVIKVTGIDRDPYAVVRVFEKNGSGTVISRNSACDTSFDFGAVRPGEFHSACLVAEPALPSGTVVTMKTGGKWYVYRVSEAVSLIDLTSFSAADGNGCYSVPRSSEMSELSFRIRIDFSGCKALPETGYESVSMVMTQEAGQEAVESAATAEERSGILNVGQNNYADSEAKEDAGEIAVSEGNGDTETAAHETQADNADTDNETVINSGTGPEENEAPTSAPPDSPAASDNADMLPNGPCSIGPETETIDTRGKANIALVGETRYRLETAPAEGSAVRIRLSKTPSAGIDVTHDKLAEALVFVPEVKLPDTAVLVVGELAYRYTDGCFLVPFASDTPDEINACFEEGSVPPGTYRFKVKRMLSQTSIPEACLNGVQIADAEFELTVSERSSGFDSCDSAEPEDNASGS